MKTKSKQKNVDKQRTHSHRAERLVRPLPAGSQIEYCGTRATIIRDDGGSTIEVEISGEGRMSWHWKFQGEECKIIQTNNSFPPLDAEHGQPLKRP